MTSNYYLNMLMPFFIYLSTLLKPILQLEPVQNFIKYSKPIAIDIVYKVAYHYTQCYEKIKKYIPESGYRVHKLYIPELNLSITDSHCIDTLIENEKIERILKFSHNDVVGRIYYNAGCKYIKPTLHMKKFILSANKKMDSGPLIDYTDLINEYARCSENNLDMKRLLDDEGKLLLNKDEEINIITQIGDDKKVNYENSVIEYDELEL